MEKVRKIKPYFKIIALLLKRYFMLLKLGLKMRDKILIAFIFINHVLMKLIPSKKIKVRLVLVQLRPEYRFWVNLFSKELYAFTEIFIENTYSYKELFESSNNIIIFDVGANIGLYSIKQAFHSKNSSIYAFEPSKISFNTFKKNIYENGLNNIKIFNICVGETSKLIKFYDSQSSVNSHIANQNDDGYQIKMESLDNIIDFEKIIKIDIIKIDTEGYEVNILKGALNKALDITESIVLELHYEGEEDEIDSILLPKKFKKLTKTNDMIFYAKHD